MKAVLADEAARIASHWLKIALAVFVIMMPWQVRPATAQEQEPRDAAAAAPIRIGPLGFGPRLAISNVGIDTNVFNEVDDPKQDFTLTASPGVELWLRTGDGMLSAEGHIDLTYFAEYSSQTGVSASASGQYEYPFNRVRPFVGFTTVNAWQRPGYEIDQRVRRYEDGVTAGVDVRVAGKSYFQLGYRRQQSKYPDDAVFDGQQLAETLNDTVTAIDALFKLRLTTMTTWMVQGSIEEDRFQSATTRNSNSRRLSTGFELGRFALIRGKAHVGFRSLEPAEGGTIRAFSGLTADLDVSYTAPSQTRITLRSARDLHYSYDPTTPYYLQTGVSLTFTQRLVSRWDVQATGALDRLTYRSALSEADNRRDVIERVGGGIGYQFAERVRFSIDAVSQRRDSALLGAYRGLRVGATVTYGY